MTLAAGMTEGHWTKAGTRIPPSRRERLLSRYTPAVPAPTSGPLSEVKTTSVLSAMPRLSSVSNSKPMLLSMAVTMVLYCHARVSLSRSLPHLNLSK